MKQSKLTGLLLTVLWLLQLGVEGLTLATVWRLEMLPDQYLLLLAAAMALLLAVTGLLLLPGRKPNKGRIRRGIACVLAAVICLGCAAVAGVVSDVYETLQNVTDNPPRDTNLTTRSLYVRRDNPAGTLAELTGHTVGLVAGYDRANTAQALAELEHTAGLTLERKEFANLQDLVQGLYDGEADVILLSDANLGVLEEIFGDFQDRARLLHEVEFQAQTEPPTNPPTVPPTDPPTQPPTDPVGPDPTDPTVPPTEPPTEPPTVPPTEPPTQPPTEPVDVTEDPFVFYMAGSDTRSSRLSSSRNDVNILVVVNPKTKQILLVNTPRDYYVPNYAGGGARDKLAHCGNYGIYNSMAALEWVYDLNVDFYGQINFRGFETFIDAIGGVTVYSDVAFTAGIYPIQRGENYLTGKMALAFARERYNLADGDHARGRHQMKIIRGVIDKLTSGTTVITRYADILDSLEGMFATDMSMSDISKLVRMQLEDLASWNIVSYAVSGTGDMTETYSAPGMDLWVMRPDWDTVAYAKSLIQRVMNGEILSQDDI
ncbi:MAG: LCP family protein [Oscillospiraceae bacterium]|nr:LCP family protein [Oscillospiraceae bacterium]